MNGQTHSNFSPGIHGARGLFCMFVVLYHIWNSGLPHWPVPILLDQAMTSLRYGVELFFAVSGFVIFNTMQRSATPLGFLANRATRIFPAMWLAILVFVPLALIDGEQSVAAHIQPLWQFFPKLIGNLLALGPIWPVPVFYGVTWTIGYEFVFYGLCFLYLSGQYYLGRDLRWPIVLLGLALVLFHPRGMFFLSGILVAMGLFQSGPLRRFAVWPLFWLALFLAAWQSVAAPVAPFFPPIPEWQLLSHWPAGITAFCATTLAIAAITQGNGRFCDFLTTRFMLWLGTISFSLYLWHPIVLGIVKFALNKLGVMAIAGNGSQLVFLIVAVPPSLLVGHISQILLEKRLTTWLRRQTLRSGLARSGQGELNATRHQQPEQSINA